MIQRVQPGELQPVTGLGSTLDNYNVTGATDQSRTMRPFRVNF
jgi:hypothetical protein